MNRPDDLVPTGRSPEFDRDTVPDALLERHELAAGRWATLHVLAGRVYFVDLERKAATVLECGAAHTVQPLAPHRVVLDDGARMQLEFFREADDSRCT